MSNFRVNYDQIAQFDCTADQLSRVKIAFSAQINSKRKQSQIRNLAQLLRILHKRDYLNVVNAEPLQLIATIIGLSLSANRASVARQTPVAAAPSPNVNLPVSEDARRRAYQLITGEIGRKWKDFARQLQIRESIIDEWGRLDAADRVHAVLRHHEERCDVRTWKSTLLKALLDARRRDLFDDVTHIFDVR